MLSVAGMMGIAKPAPDTTKRLDDDSATKVGNHMPECVGWKISERFHRSVNGRL